MNVCPDRQKFRLLHGAKIQLQHGHQRHHADRQPGIKLKRNGLNKRGELILLKTQSGELLTHQAHDIDPHPIKGTRIAPEKTLSR